MLSCGPHLVGPVEAHRHSAGGVREGQGRRETLEKILTASGL